MLRRAPGVMYEVVDGRAVLVDPQGAELVTLNPTGTLIWEALDGPSDADAIASRLIADLEGVTEDELRADVEAFLADLRKQGLVEESER